MSSNLLAAETLAKAIHQVAGHAHSEEDLRVGVEHALSATLQALGLTATPEYEKTTLSGSADAVYGHAVIEYKRPGRLAEKGFPAKLAAQIARYLADQASHAGGPAKQVEALEKMIGIGTDGEQMLFLRYSASGRMRESPMAAFLATPHGVGGQIAASPLPGSFQMVGPVPVGRESVELLLLYLRSLSRKPLTPEALAADFGPQGDVAPHLVNLFYNALQAHRDHPRVATFFAEWERIFGIVYGEELGQAEKDAPELAALYGRGKACPYPQGDRKGTPLLKPGTPSPSPEGDRKGTPLLKPLFFAIHTYYALLIKFLAVELASLQGGALVGSFVAALPALPDDALRRELANLENGGTFALLGINNFLEGDFFGWYLDAWGAKPPAGSEPAGGSLAGGIRTLARRLADFEPATPTLEPEHTRDLLKKLYQYLVPRKLRHDLGEYYTPDWLAERLLNQVGYTGEPDKRLIDPGCGSGTFPILALRRLRQYAADHLIPPADVLDAALKNIVGFDLNPLSVIAARTNYLLALGDLLRYRRGPVDLPVYMCDSILTPTERTDMFGKSYRLHTVVGDFEIPGEIVAAGEMGALSALLESCVRNGYAPEEFLARARRELSVSQPMSETVLEALYRRFLTLQQEGRNGIWARLIKNAFAPALVGEFDFVVGNPPWVRWGYKATRYPVSYTRWSKVKAIDEDMSLDQVTEATRRRNLYAEPVGGSEVGPWQTGSRRLLRILKRLAGPARYTAHIGARTDPYGVYWVRILETLPDGRVVIENLADMSKTRLPTVRKAIKPDLLFPAIKGADVLRWKVTPRAYVLMVQDVKTRTAYDEAWLKIEHPDVYSYFKEFEQVLKRRGSRAVQRVMERSAFYAMFAIGAYTFAEHKVVWRRMDNTLRAAVIGVVDGQTVGNKVLVPIDTVTLVDTKIAEEAHFVCSLMNSSVAGMLVSSFSASGRGFGTPSILEYVPIPEYDPHNPLHTRLAALSQQAHQLAARQTSEVSSQLAAVEAQVDEAAAELWGITDRELQEIRRSLAEFR